MSNVFDEQVSGTLVAPKPLKGFLQKRGPKAHHPWKRRWFILDKNKLRYYKDQTDTEPIAIIGLEHCTSLWRTSSVAPKKLVDCAFALDIREHKKIRTYYLSAHSSGEKKQWLDAMLQSKKFYAQNQGSAGARSSNARASSNSNAGMDKELSDAKQRIKALQVENQRLLDEIEDLQAGLDGEDREELLVELEECQEQLEEERARRKRLEKKMNDGDSRGRASEINEEEIREDVRLEFEDRIEDLEAEIRQLKKGKGKSGGKRQQHSDEDDSFDVPDFDDPFADDEPVKRGGGGGDKKLQEQNKKLKREIESLKKKLKSGGSSDARTEDLEDEVEELQEEVERLTEQVADLELDLQDAKKGGGGGGDEELIAELEAENADFQAQLEELEAHVDEIEAESAAKARKIKELEKEVASGGGGADEDALAELQQQVDDLNEQLDELEEENSLLQQDLEEARRSGGGGGGDAELEETNARLEEELEEAKQSAAQYRAKLSLLRKEYKKLLKG